MENQKKKTSEYAGVHWNTSRGKWLAVYEKDGKKHIVGQFNDEDEAGVAMAKATSFRDDWMVDDLPGEKWGKLKRHKKTYLVSNMGRVKAPNFNKTGRERLLKLNPNGNGYPSFATSEGKTRRTIILHRAVWEAFNRLLKKGEEINHKDFDKTNAKLSNLELMTHAENMKHYHDSIDKGVGYYYKHHGPRWILFMVVNGTKRPMGSFDSLEEAQAYHRDMMGCDLVEK